MPKQPTKAVYSERIKSAQKFLSLSEKRIKEILSEAGINDTEEDLKLLDSEIVTKDILKNLFKGKAPLIKVLAAASALKGEDPLKSTDKISILTKNSKTTIKEDLSLTTALKDILPKMKTDFKQLRDKDLLDLYIDHEDYEILQELHRRAKYQPFVVLTDDKKIDVENSLELLKRSRRMVNPTLIPMGESVVPVYRITEINPEDNIIEICPLCENVLYKEYCDKCQTSFKGIGKEEKAYMNMVSNSERFNKSNYSDIRALVSSAIKGVEDLYKTWPSMIKLFEELKLMNRLPSFKKVRELPSVKPADPFYSSDQ